MREHRGNNPSPQDLAAAVLPPASSSKSCFCNQSSKGFELLASPRDPALACSREQGETFLGRAPSRAQDLLNMQWGAAELLVDHAARCWMLLGVPLSAACFVGLPLGHCLFQSRSSHSLELDKCFLLSPSPDLSVMCPSVLSLGISFWICFVSLHPISHIPSPHTPSTSSFPR